VDETADINNDLPDELFDNLDDNDDDNSVTSSVDSSGFQEHDQLEDHYEINSNASTKSVSPTQSPVPSETSSTDEEDAEEIQTDDITASKELNPDEYEGESVSKTSQPQPQPQPNVVVGEIVNIRLALTTVPEDIKLCDENGEQNGCRRVFLLLNQNIKNLNIGKEHRIGNRVYGFDAEYPVYNVLTM
jgi:hypothetical protein